MATAIQHIKKAGDEKKPLNSSKIVHLLIITMFCPLMISKALSLAMSRDGSSGGTIRMCVITEDAVERIFIPGDKLPRFWEGREVLGTATKKSDLDIAPMAVEI
jgi:hypothetical protein